MGLQMWCRDRRGKHLSQELLSFPHSGITVPRQADNMVTFAVLKQSTSVVVRVMTQLRGACRTLGRGATALFLLCLPKHAPTPP